MTLDFKSATQDEITQALIESGDLSSKGYFWTTKEVRILTENYPVLGATKTAPLLPGRTLRTIYGKARQLGLSAPHVGTKGVQFIRKYEKSEQIDNVIREGYIHQTKKGDLKRLAERLGRPTWWVQKRAARLGLTRTVRTRVDAWSAEELAIVEEWAMCDHKVICQKLKKAGFYRTPTAVGIQIKRRDFDTTNPNEFTTLDVSKMLGVNPATIGDWIERRGLRAEKRAYGHTGRYFIQRKHLKGWIASNPRFVDLRRVDQVWFMDLIFGAGDL